MKKLIGMAALGALVASMALPASAANPTGNITVKWNIAASGTLTLNQNYNTSTGAAQTTAPSILANTNGGGGSCTATGNGSEAAATVNYGNITPDTAVSEACYYKNAVNAVITTNDTSWDLTEKLSAGLTSGFHLCGSGNGFTWGGNSGASLPVTGSSAVAAPAPSAGNCGTGETEITTTAANAMVGTAAFSSSGNIGEDYELVVPALAAFGAGTGTVVYTLVLN